MLIAKETVSVMNDTIIRQIFSAANFWLWDKYFFSDYLKKKNNFKIPFPKTFQKVIKSRYLLPKS